MAAVCHEAGMGVATATSVAWWVQLGERGAEDMCVALEQKNSFRHLPLTAGQNGFWCGSV